MLVRYSPRAVQDIDALLAYIHKRSPQGALKASLAVEHTVSVCAEYPRSGTRTNKPGTYRRPLAKYRFTLFYRIIENEGCIEIIRLVRGGRVKNLSQVPKT